MKQKVKLKRGYNIIIDIPEDVGGDRIISLGSYSKSQFGQTCIVEPSGISPTHTGNHGEVVAIIERIEDE